MLMMQRTACITLRVPRYAGSVSPHPRVQLGCVRGPQRAEERGSLFVWRELRAKARCVRRGRCGRASRLTFSGKAINMAFMKTTLTLPDDVFRKAKARAALRGQTFGKFLEQSLQRTLSENEGQAAASNSWLLSLPRLPRGAATDVQRAVDSEDFRTVDQAMWQ